MSESIDIYTSNKKYSVILADPPWRYSDSGCNGAAEKQYPTMSLEDIKALPVHRLTESNCVLFLWATYPMLREALQVIDSWEFNYKSIAFQWVKRNPSGVGWFFGLGRWTRGNTEPCLLAVRGKPKRVNNSISQLIVSSVGAHSAKPHQQYPLIERLLGSQSRLELFARGRREGWDCWGNQLDQVYERSLK